MTKRDLATIALRTLSAWLFASGVAGLCSAVLTWGHSVTEYGTEGAIFGATAAGIFTPIGALGWLLSNGAAKRIFPEAEANAPSASRLTRPDLYAFASVLVGLYLLSNSVPMIV
jgi:hypothetical protein